jgi:flagellar biosynthesis GTPase FlhF
MSSISISQQMNKALCNVAQELAVTMVRECGKRYSFDAETAIRELGLETVTMVQKNRSSKGKEAKRERILVAKASFPLPFNGECKADCCQALRQNNGLYTQCQANRKDGKDYCKSCQQLADKSADGIPEYGTIQQRTAVDIFEYVDPKGRKPVSYTKVMKKYKLTQEQVLEEAGKFNIIINESHFVAPTIAVKRGRPASAKTPKEPKGAKGRPKKAKKVLQIEGDEDDLFAALVADANEEQDNVSDVTESSTSDKTAKLAADKAAKAAEKKEKEEQRLKEKAEKEAKLAAEKAAKEQAKLEKEEQRLKEKAEKEAKLAAEKAAKEQAKLAKEQAKKVEKKSSKKAAEEPVKDEEPDVVKKIEFEGKKYLKSKKTGIIYDYNEYVKNGEQVVVGKWNESKNKVEFQDAGEESEEEYDE